MKKLLNKKFGLILGSTITLLVVLTIAMTFLTKENTKSFTRSGYIIASSKEESIKYYFDKGTTYKTNINSELVFTDKSGEKVNVETDNFLHYVDGGIKFLKNGVIMDLDNVNGTIVPYYNITNKSLLEYSKKSYYIETLDKTLSFNNIIGRISENKYLVAGVDIKLQLAGNDKVITGDYFEITFVEDGVIKIENQEFSYQTTAENSYVLVGDTTKIDLGLKKVYYNEEEKMSLTQMTIDGNENIEIIPTEDENGGSGGGAGGSGDGTGEDSKEPGEGDGTGSGGSGGGGAGGSGDGTGEDSEEPGEGDGTGSGGSGGGGAGGSGDGTGEDSEEPGEGDGTGSGGSGGGGSGGGYVEKRANVELVEAKVEADSINAKFYLNNPDGNVKLEDLIVYMTNTDTGDRVEYAVSKLPQTQINEDQLEFTISRIGLAPNSNYLISVNEEKEDTQYFQKLFKTDGLGISLEKAYATSDSLAYEVIFEEESPVNSVWVRLKDDENSEPIEITRDDTNKLAVFTGLTSNTSYNIELYNVSLSTLEYGDRYRINKTGMTLKKQPEILGLTSEASEENNEFTLGIEDIKNNSITKYEYHIYNADEATFENRETREAVLVITKNDAGKVKVPIDGEKIRKKVNYKFKVVAEYYDNEKYVEIETDLSDGFILAERPYIKWEMDHENSSFNTISGTIVIVDENCTIPLKGRNCSTVKDYENKFKMEYFDITNQSQKTVLENLDFKLVVDEEFNKEHNLKEGTETLQKYIEVNSLRANKDYKFLVYGDVDLRNSPKPTIIVGHEIGSFDANTNGVDILTVDTWIQNDTGVEDLINLTTRIISTNNNDKLAESLRNITFNLYPGDVKDALELGINKVEAIGTFSEQESLKEKYYKTLFTLNTKNTFGFVDTTIETEDGPVFSRAIDLLKAKTDGKLPEKYTIEITDVKDEAGNAILIENGIYVFQTPPTIRIEENEILPLINADPITNENLIFDEADKEIDEACERPLFEEEEPEELSEEERPYEKIYNKDLGCTTLVGYTVDVAVNLNILKKYFSDINELIYYVCDADVNPNCTIENAVETRTINLKETEETKTIFYLENGTEYNVEDTKLSRGHNYIFKANFKVKYGKQTDANTITEVETLYPMNGIKTEKKATPKQGATYSIYIDKTTASEVFYKYSFIDIDKTLYDNKFYYTVDNNEVQTFDFSDEDFVINNLTNDSVYSLSFKRALIKNTNSIENVEVGKYIFDGEHIYSEDVINFENVTSPNDNRLRVLILENELNQKFVNRISAYQITLSTEDENIKDYVRVYPTNSSKIETCTKDEVEYRCIVVDYADIKEFKTKDTTVKVTAYYDSGIINNDFVNISKSDIGYILQTNNIYNPDKIRGRYIDINSNGGISTTELPYGIYEYNGNTSKKLQIERKIDLNNFIFKNENVKQPDLEYANDSIYIKDSGGNNISINNKLLSKVDLSTNNSKFKFNSYIPKIKVSTQNLVNGTILTIEPTGLDETILKEEFKEEDGKYYYYLKIYEEVTTETEEGTETDLVLFKEEKVEINKEFSQVTLTKYMPNTTYYFEVYAYMLKDKEYKETLLFDANTPNDYVTSIYDFKTLSKEEIQYYDPIEKKPVIKTIYTSKSETNEDGTLKEDGIYSMRELTLQINTMPNIGEYSVKFELYDIDDNLVYEEITETKIADSDNCDILKVVKDITNEDFVFGNGYYTLKIYTLTDVFDSDEKAALEVHNSKINIKKLVDPTLTVTKSEDVNSLNFIINIKDSDKVIKDGKYCVELLNEGGKPLNIPNQETKICGLNVNVFDEQGITFSNLNPDTVYIFRVFADVYTNNIDLPEEKKEREVEARRVLSTSTEYGVALGSVAAKHEGTGINLSFSSGVNVQNIREITYTIMEQGGKEVTSSTYVMGVDKNFIVSIKDNITKYTLIINPEGITIPKDAYLVLTYWVDKLDENKEPIIGEDGKPILVPLNNKEYTESID